MVTNKRKTLNRKYKLEDHEITEVMNHPYLGLELSNTLKWDLHIRNIVSKANRSLGFVKRNLGKCPERIKKQAYLALVRPHLEYASTVWSPHTTKQKALIERVQRKSLRFIKKCYINEPGTVTSLGKTLEINSLESRREKARVCMLYEIINGQIDMKIPEYIQPLKNNRTRQYNNNKFYPPHNSTDAYKNSFFPATIGLWNKLPINIIGSETIKQFKEELDLIM